MERMAIAIVLKRNVPKVACHFGDVCAAVYSAMYFSRNSTAKKYIMGLMDLRLSLPAIRLITT